MGLGAAATLAYALFDSFAILLAARLAWGLSWSFIRHASVMNLAATDPAARGQMMGFYSALSRTGGIAGIVLGGLMFDVIGFEATFLLLALVSALAVPMPLRVGFTTSEHWRAAKEGGPNALLIAGLCVSAVGPGFVMSTLGFVLMDRFGESLTVAGLAIGIATSVFCALFVSRLFLTLLLQLGVRNLISLQAIEKSKAGDGIDFLKYRKPAFLLSWAVVAVGLFSVYSKRDTILGIDFRGGEELVADFSQAIDPGDLDNALKNNPSLGEVQHVYRSEVGSGEGSTRLVLQTEEGKGRKTLAYLQENFSFAGLEEQGLSNKIGRAHV